MNEYKLLKPSAVLAELNKAIKVNLFWYPLEEEGCLDYWKSVLDNLTEDQYSGYISWKNIEKFESVHHLEALFLLLDLPTKFLLENKEFNLYRSPYSNGCSDSRVREVFTNTIEFQALERSNQEWLPGDLDGESKGNNFDVIFFIKWSIERGFIEKLDNTEEYEPSSSPFGKYNDYRGWAKVHNTIATIVALELYKGTRESTSSILKDNKFYGQLSKNLVPKKEDGIDKPKPKTLENYISEYNNFNK